LSGERKVKSRHLQPGQARPGQPFTEKQMVRGFSPYGLLASTTKRKILINKNIFFFVSFSI
jgi:hypothetical protein